MRLYSSTEDIIVGPHSVTSRGFLRVIIRFRLGVEVFCLCVFWLQKYYEYMCVYERSRSPWGISVCACITALDG